MCFQTLDSLSLCPKLQGTLKTVPEKADWANKGLEMELERSAGLVLPESRGSIRGRQRGR